jgi:hypothetical protein
MNACVCQENGVSTSTPIFASSKKMTDIIPDGIFSPVIIAKELFKSRLPVLKQPSSANTPASGTLSSTSNAVMLTMFNLNDVPSLCLHNIFYRCNGVHKKGRYYSNFKAIC